MRLVKFRVMNFRSVADSGWVETNHVTALIGVNESGKTNLLLPLWKLNPAGEGEIEQTSDYPKTMFGAIREKPGDHEFIEAEFETGTSASEIARAAKVTHEVARTVRVKRSFDGKYTVQFPKHTRSKTIDRKRIIGELDQSSREIQGAKPLASEVRDGLQNSICEGLHRITAELPTGNEFNISQLKAIRGSVQKLTPRKVAKSSKIVPKVQKLAKQISTHINRIAEPDPGDDEKVVETVTKALPRFVYYSNYGNLDSEIYLPHVVDNLARGDLGTKEAAKARTLHVLFTFVGLKAEEILELGKDFLYEHNLNQDPTPKEIEEVSEKKRIRSILLQSAGSNLTSEFRDWWQQGDYIFRFEADGNHFRIWVSDDRRRAEVELENRSSGLQWFLSFYLVFLVESRGQHKEAVLLLDEPGMSLHPIAQRDLSRFFENLSERNQIIYTSHSPFLVDADRLDRARKVYVARDGTTKATSNLRHGERQDEQVGSSYAVYSALNLNVAESFLLGCQPILVEGASDQHYRTAIKALLVSDGKITPTRELVFPPSGGAKTARVVASILTGRDQTLPMVLLDADGPGKQMAKDLTKAKGLYAEAPKRVLSVADFADVKAAETEDLFPPKFLADELDRMERRPETRLADCVREGVPFVEQAERWAESHSINLSEHWKVKLAIRVKQQALTKGIGAFDENTVEQWERLFDAFNM